MTTAALIVGLTTLLCIVPAPFHTLAEGVVWLPDEAFVRVGAGWVRAVHRGRTRPQVQAGDVLIVCHNPELVATVRPAGSCSGAGGAVHRTTDD